MLRTLPILLAGTTMAVFSQTSAPVKAGDPAPSLEWTRILSGGEPGTFFGRVTVIGFFPLISNESMVSQWNELAGKFTGQPVQFAWITSEHPPPPDAWMKDHPVSGCLLLDPPGSTAHTYGADFGGAIVDTNGRVAGFTFILPEEDQVKAVLTGQAVAIRGDANDSQMEAILSGRAVRLDAEPQRPPAPEGKPATLDIPPSPEVRISPSKTKGTEENQGPGWWVLRGFDLKAAIATIYERDPSRIVLPDALATDDRYDFVFVPPNEMDLPAMRRQVQQALEQHFHVAAAVESRPADVYVMTAIKGKTPPPKTGDAAMGGGSVGWASSAITVARPPGDGAPTNAEIQEILANAKPASMSSLSAENVDMADFRRMLEQGLDRPVVDETKLEGSYDIEVHGSAKNNEEFFAMLKDQVGLVLAPEHRPLEMLVVRLVP